MNNPTMENSRKINGFFIPNDQIKFWEENFSGKLVVDEKVNAILSAAVSEHLKRGKEPGPMRVRELFPFKWFIPVRIAADIVGTGISNIQTNKFIFIETKAVM